MFRALALRQGGGQWKWPMNFINSFDNTKYSPTYAALVSLETYPFRQALITMYLSVVYMYVFTV